MSENNNSLKKLQSFNPKEEEKKSEDNSQLSYNPIEINDPIVIRKKNQKSLYSSAQLVKSDLVAQQRGNTPSKSNPKDGNEVFDQLSRDSSSSEENKDEEAQTVKALQPTPQVIQYEPTVSQLFKKATKSNNMPQNIVHQSVAVENNHLNQQQSNRTNTKSRSSKSKGKITINEIVDERSVGHVRINTPDRHSTEQLLQPNFHPRNPLDSLPTIENPNKHTVLMDIENSRRSPIQAPINIKKSTRLKLRQALNKIDTKPFGKGGIEMKDDELELIDRRIQQSKTLAEISYNMLRGERVRKSWLKDAEKNRFLRKDKIDSFKEDENQTGNRRRKIQKGQTMSQSVINTKQFEMEKCDTTAQIFQQQKDQFTNMTKKQSVETQYDIVTVMLNISSELLVVLSEASESHFCVTIFDIKNHHTHFQFDIYGKFIKARDFVQNLEGNMFCIPYLDAGDFNFVVFDQKKQLWIVNVNELLGIDNSSQGINGFFYPLINACFIKDDKIFINVFHRTTITNWHFLFCCKTGRVVREPVALKTSFSELNFPLNCFFDEENELVYCFFRQSQCLTISVREQSDGTKNNQDIFLKIKKLNSVAQTRQQHTLWDNPKIQKFADKAMGQFVLYKNQVLIAKSSKSLHFFKLVFDPNSEIKEDKNWEHYFKLKIIGDIFYSQGSQWLTVTSDVYIYFYRIELDDLKPTLENCIYNFMNCSQLIYGQGDQNYCMTYKVGQQDFNIYERKFNHGFNVILDENSKSNCFGVDCKSMECFMVSNSNHTISVYEYETFREVSKIELILNSFQQGCVILNMKLCESDRYLAILLGQVTTQQTYFINSLMIYEINMNDQTYDFKYTRAIPQSMNNVSLQFEFFNRNVNEILFTDYKEIIRFDYVNYTINTYFQFKLQLNCSPEYVLFNRDQRIVMIASFYDVLWINLETDQELDIDNDFCIGNIRQIINYEKSFYILANKSNKKIGYYLIQIDEDNPVLTDSSYVINSNSKYDIGDANLFILDNEQGEKHLMVTQKTIGVNTYNIIVIDLKTRHIVFRYEMHQLWESTVRGLLLSTNEFIKLARDGMSMMKVFSSFQKRILKNMQGKRWMQHSLQHCNYLKISEENHILIEEKGSGNNKRRIISIQEQYSDPNGDTHFDIIYKIKVQNMSLMELLLFQSIFACKQQADIVSLIEAQPLPKVFYKSYDEIGFSNMVTVLSFDSRPIQKLLNPDKQHLYSTKYPLIYKCVGSSRKQTIYKSAIDISLESNQIRATTLIIDYIINHQNSYVFSFLFKDNLIKIINRGVKVAKLLQSDIFCHKFDYEYWPSTHIDNSTELRTYNLSIFQIRSMYNRVFPDYDSVDDCQIRNNPDQKLYKIKYTLNLLPDMDYVEDGSLMNALGDVEELEIFDNKVVKDLIEFKWKQYAGKFHYIGATIHVIYVLIFNYYVSSFLQYQHQHAESETYQLYLLNFVMMFCLVYPLIYDMTQLRNQGFKEYFSDKWNHCDQLHIWCGFINCLVQLMSHGAELDNLFIDRFQKSLMILVTFLMLIKTFFFLRIFHQLSYIVTMMKVVFYDLRVFMYFYLILLFMFSIILSILKVGNFELSNDESIRTLRQKSSYPNMEYKHLSYSLQNFMTVLRISLGDFNFEAPTLLDSFDNILFWIIWVIIVIMTCIIFLNFIIAEVSSSYESVKHDVNGLILKERASLIKESEDMMLESSKLNREKFPKYIIMRECEE